MPEYLFNSDSTVNQLRLGRPLCSEHTAKAVSGTQHLIFITVYGNHDIVYGSLIRSLRILGNEAKVLRP